MYFVRNLQDREIYLFEVYEKWWYCFFLCFAWLLPHHVYKIENYDEETLRRSKKDKKVGFWPMLGMIIGTIGFATFPNEIYFKISSKNALIYAIAIYLLCVIMCYVCSKILKKKKSWTCNEEKVIILKFNFLRFAPLNGPFIFLGIISTCVITFFAIDEISLKNLIGLISACIIVALASLCIGATAIYTSKQGERYLLGPLRFFPE